MRKKVGTYELGHEKVTLIIESGKSGEFDMGEHEIIVGVDCPYEELYSVLLHEAMEYAYHRQHCRYHQANEVAPFDNGSFIFVASHTEFSQVTSAAGMFIVQCQEDLKKKWEEINVSTDD